MVGMLLRMDTDYNITFRRRGEVVEAGPVRFFARSVAWFGEFPDDPNWLLTFDPEKDEKFTVRESDLIEAEPVPRS